MKNKANYVIIYEIVGEGVYEKRNIRFLILEIQKVRNIGQAYLMK